MKKNWLLAGMIVFVSVASFGQTQENVVPQFRSDEEKVKWVNEHPEEYKKLNGEEVLPTERPAEFRTDAEKSAYLRANGLGKEITILEDVPGFPKYIDTGNPEMDKADYSYRKDLWVEQNQDLYNKLTQTAEDNMSKEERLQKGEIIIRN